MKLSAQAENIRTLAAALGIAEDKASELLNVTVVVTFDQRDETASIFAGHVQRLLSRTIGSVVLNKIGNVQTVAAELVVGNALRQFTVACLFVSFGIEKVIIAGERENLGRSQIHPVGLVLGACYAAGATLKKALQDLIPFPSSDRLEIDLANFIGEDLQMFYQPLLFDEAYLAGAGAIGNGFVYGLSQFDARGRLHIVDDDSVSHGNLQRCVYFGLEDVGLSKADRLSLACKPILPGVETIPQKVRLQNILEKGGSAWLKRLIVGVDSRRARRSLQSEIPGEVFDASTTGISEVVLHFHRQPTDLACMSCIYHESPDEHAHERHVAETLGVTVEAVKQERISEAAALSICEIYPQLNRAELVGLAYDTLFKQLCSTGKLMNPEGRQVLAPFAFISVLAGTLLAIEFNRRIQNGGAQRFNEWRVSPWANPVFRRRRVAERNPDCEFCGNSTLARAAHEIWRQPFSLPSRL